MSKGTNGQQEGAANHQKFLDWRKEMDELGDDAYRAIIYRKKKLSRKVIRTACGFGDSVLRQNPHVVDSLADLESDLRKRGVLPPLEEEPSPPEDGAEELEQAQAKRDKQADLDHVHRLEQENIELRARVAELEKDNEEFERKLGRLDAFRSALDDVGRLPK